MEVEKGVNINKNDLDLKLRLVAMQISSGLIRDAELSLIEMQHKIKIFSISLLIFILNFISLMKQVRN